MTKKRKPKPAQPDEFFARGPIRVARFGNNIAYESNWPEGEFAEMQKRAVTMCPEIVKEIDDLVEAIAHLVSELPPDKLLHRAWWEVAVRAVTLEAEIDVDADDTVAMRMIDYVQSVIASVKPSEEQRRDVTEGEWQALREKVDRLFRTLNGNYQICRTVKAKVEDLALTTMPRNFISGHRYTGATSGVLAIRTTRSHICMTCSCRTRQCWRNFSALQASSSSTNWRRFCLRTRSASRKSVKR